METKNIKIDKESWEELSHEKIDLGLEKIADVIQQNLKIIKKFGNEKSMSNWFENNYKKLGFKNILTKRTTSFPDYKMLTQDNKEIELELETLSSNFIKHNHDINKVDLIICLVKDIDLPKKIIELNTFEYINNHTSISISSNTWKLLNNLKEVPTDTFDVVIQRLIKLLNKF